jgi:hypothetical protein
MSVIRQTVNHATLGHYHKSQNKHFMQYETPECLQHFGLVREHELLKRHTKIKIHYSDMPIDCHFCTSSGEHMDGVPPCLEQRSLSTEATVCAECTQSAHFKMSSSKEKTNTCT